MLPLVVVENPGRWPLEVEGAEIVSAKDYLVEPRYSHLRRAAVYNLCRRYGYQSTGYYVSLLAAARGHRPLPSVATLQSLLLSPVIRVVSEELDELIQRSLSSLRSEQFELSIYFGHNVARRYGRLARALFNHFPAPFLRARFIRDSRWKLQAIRPIATAEIPEKHNEFVLDRTREYFARPYRGNATLRRFRYDLAILWEEEDEKAPSDARAIRRFTKAAESEGIGTTLVSSEDYGRIAEFDALWIRATTAVNHYSFRFAQRAAVEGLVVIDDPESIIRCTNKVYQAELFRRNGIPTPATMVVHPENVASVATQVGLPCVLKAPDSAFSQGVLRVETENDLVGYLNDLFRTSELIVAQAWTPSSFDWRIGILDGSAIYACRYHMARGHWQIIRQQGPESPRFGRVEALPLDAVPAGVLDVAARAASLIGKGLYGVDLKVMDDRVLVMEVNDNPNIEAGFEDAVDGEGLYHALARHFRRRLDERGERR